MQHRAAPWALAGLLLALASCEDPALSTLPAASPHALPTPATPRPTGVATPRPASPQLVATPTPLPSSAQPPSPTPAASGQPTPAPPTPSPSLPPAPEGFARTGRPLDAAASGPGYFVLSTRAQPAGPDDLRLTRDGRFYLEHDASGNLPLWRLKHQPEGLFVVGFQAPQGPEEAPEEAASGVFTTTWSGLPAAPVGLHLDAERNPKAPEEASWDFRGRLLLKGQAPREASGQALVAYLALATVAQPEALASQAGFPGLLRLEAASLPWRLGVAVSGGGRPLGNAHLVLPSTLAILPDLPLPTPAPLLGFPSPLPSPLAAGALEGLL